MSRFFIHFCRNLPLLLLPFHPPPPHLVTAWHYCDGGAVALLWQQAGRPGYVLVKRTACQKESEREGEIQVPPNSWAQAPTTSPQPPPQGLSNTTHTLGTPRISHSSSSHTCTLHAPPTSSCFSPNFCIRPWFHHSSPTLAATFLPHSQTHTLLHLALLSGPTLYLTSLCQSVLCNQVKDFK